MKKNIKQGLACLPGHRQGRDMYKTLKKLIFVSLKSLKSPCRNSWGFGAVRYFVIFLIFLTGLTAISLAKTQKITFSGYSSTVFEAQRSSDTAKLTKRIPSCQFNLNSTIGLRSFNIGVRTFYNTPHKRQYQQQNQFGLNPAWNWGKVYLGDFTPNFTENTLNYAPIFGAGIEFFPKFFRFSLLAGQSRKTYSGYNDYSYKRNLYALKFGTSFLSLNLIKGKDDTLSIIGTPAETAYSFKWVKPQENLTAGLASNFSLFKVFSFELEGVRSFHTSDLRSDTASSQAVPQLVLPLYQPRCSTKVDHGLKGVIKLYLKKYTFDLTLTQLGPGFASLGVPYIKNDSRKGKFGINTTVIPKSNLNLSFEREYDNLKKDKTGTTTSNVFYLSARYSPINKININLNYNLRQSERESEQEIYRMNNFNHYFSLSPNFNYTLLGINHNSYFYMNYMEYESKSPTYKYSYRNLNVNFNHTMTPKMPVSFTSTIGHTLNFSTQSTTANSNLSLTANHQLLKNRLRNRLTLSFQPSSQGKTYGFRLGSDYTFGRAGTLSLSGDLSYFSSQSKDVKNYTLQNISATYSLNFF